jgi:hypothetical protein
MDKRMDKQTKIRRTTAPVVGAQSLVRTYATAPSRLIDWPSYSKPVVRLQRTY